jgi:hypothetical protein
MKTRVATRFVVEREAELCEKFIDIVRLYDYVVYPEISNWDIVIILPGGAQFGVQAKMRPNIDVVYQCVRNVTRGPRYRAVLLPRYDDRVKKVCLRLGLKFFSLLEILKIKKDPIELFGIKDWGSSKLWVPPIETPSIIAGDSAPKRFTKWRYNAIRLCIILEHRGYLISKDFDTLGVNKSYFLSTGAIVRSGKIGKFVKYAKGSGELPSKGFEKEFELLKENFLRGLRNE